MGELKFSSRRAARRDSLHEKEDLSQTAQDTARFLNRDAACLKDIRDLYPDENLALLTPYLPSSSKPASDPFEPLGRALEAHRGELRHIPYVPENGLTPTHLAFLQHAAAVVLVIFPNYPQERRRLPPVESLLKMDPAGAASHQHHYDAGDSDDAEPPRPIEMLAPSFDGAMVLERLRELPTVLVLVDDDAESEEATAQVDELVMAMGKGAAVVRTQSYDEAALRHVADLLFE